MTFKFTYTYTQKFIAALIAKSRNNVHAHQQVFYQQIAVHPNYGNATRQIKRNYRYKSMNFKIIMLNGGKKNIKRYILWFHWFKILEKANIYTGRRSVVARFMGQEVWEMSWGEMDYKGNWGNFWEWYVPYLFFNKILFYLFFLYWGIIAIQHISFRYMTIIWYLHTLQNNYHNKSS